MGHLCSQCASYPLNDDESIVKQILPHKLSLVFKRRPCINMTNDACYDDAPPMADYPRYASGELNILAYSDMHTFDIKVPSEHTVNGLRYDAEIQMFHTSLSFPRLSSLGILIKADDGLDNTDYQLVLNEFTMVYNMNTLQCARKRLRLRRHRRRRRMAELRGRQSSETADNETPNVNVEEDDIDEENLTEEYLTEAIQNITTSRNLQWTVSNFDPYDFLTTMFFFRYDGSITEPPCKDITWWVMDQPMRISQRQLEETRRILFTNVNENCIPTSVHNGDQSVARPTSELDGREIQHCSEGSFASDIDTGRPAGRQCTA